MTAVLEDKVKEIVSSADINEICDKCGGSVHALYAAQKDGTQLFFCGHHIRAYADTLKSQGFSIKPENISYNAGAFPPAV